MAKNTTVQVVEEVGDATEEMQDPFAPDPDAMEKVGAFLNGPSTVVDDSFLSSIDLTKVSGGDYAILTNGETYEFDIVKATFGVTQSSGNKHVKLTLIVTDDYAEAGGMILDTITLTEGAMWRFKSLCKATGLLGDSGLFSGTGAGSFVGMRVRAKVKNEQWQGEWRTKIDGAYRSPDTDTIPSSVETTNVIPDWGV